MLLWCKTTEIQIFSFAGFASIRQVPTVLASPGRRVANAFGGFAIDTNYERCNVGDLLSMSNTKDKGCVCVIICQKLCYVIVM